MKFKIILRHSFTKFFISNKFSNAALLIYRIVRKLVPKVIKDIINAKTAIHRVRILLAVL